ncbi:GntR family transcriptional regulator [Paraburkholderia sp. J67]|uniref:GntR family transcriptional regulator n=1 Tax=Paraburkholderia sp. J67 TaxID=2805435 RepID=UPI002ABDEA0D|nr:GntR family transcriptional regulator [Paraburkholderia sp. J67]
MLPFQPGHAARDLPTRHFPLTGFRISPAYVGAHPIRHFADQIEEAVLAGILRAGDKLPTQRDLAEALHLNTINAAFRGAERRGLIESRTRRGSMVSAMC